MSGQSDLPVDDDHALMVGALMGMVMRARQEGFQYQARVLDDPEGRHLAHFEITAPSGRYLVRVEKLAAGQDEYGDIDLGVPEDPGAWR